MLTKSKAWKEVNILSNTEKQAHKLLNIEQPSNQGQQTLGFDSNSNMAKNLVLTFESLNLEFENWIIDQSERSCDPKR